MSIKTWVAKGSVALNMMNGNQTQHRIPMNPQPRLGLLGNGQVIRDDYFVWDSPQAVCPIVEKGMYRILRQAQYQPGDVVWVREPGRVVAYEESADCQYEWMRIKYMADGHEVEINTPWRMSDVWDGNGQKYPYGAPDWVWKKQGIPNGIFKEAARTFLKVNKVRIERVTDISWQDACAEGFTDYGDNPSDGHRHDPVGWFHDLWESIYPGTWKRNHWVWVYEFERTDKPADWPTN